MVEFKIGVIALQGDVSEHVAAVQRALDLWVRGSSSAVPIRRAGAVADCDGLVLPGGESTTLSRQLSKAGLDQEIKAAAASGVPIFATCAGLVLVSKAIQDDSKVRPLGLMDITIGRNIFGTQKDSFEADLEVLGIDRPFHAVFIRAPAIISVGKGVSILAKVDEHVVAAREKNVLGLAFHPELTEDLRFHRLFLDMIGAK